MKKKVMNILLCSEKSYNFIEGLLLGLLLGTFSFQEFHFNYIFNLLFLCVESDQNYNNIDEEVNEISGRRIFNVQYLFEQMAAIDHTPFNCTFKDLRFVA